MFWEYQAFDIQPSGTANVIFAWGSRSADKALLDLERTFKQWATTLPA